MAIMGLSISKYELEGLKILSERRGYQNKSDLIRQGIRLLFEREGIKAKEIEKRIKAV